MLKRWLFIFFVLLTLFLLSQIVLHAYIGTYSRLIADDFRFVIDGGIQNILTAAYELYIQWTGRFSANILDYAIGSLGLPAAPYSTAAVLTLWGGALFFVFFQLRVSQKYHIRFIVSLCAAILILSATLSLTPSVAQSLYWGSGMRPVVPPLILGTLYIGLIWALMYDNGNSKFSWGKVILAFLIPFIAGGFNESFTIVQLILLAFAFLYSIFRFHKKGSLLFQSFFGAGFLGALLSLLIMISAPGNEYRQSLYSGPHSIIEVIRVMFNSAIVFWGRLFLVEIPLDLAFVITRLSVIVSLIVLPALLTAIFLDLRISPILSLKNEIIWLLAGLPILLFLLVLACFFPGAYATVESIPKRTQIIPAYIFVIIVFIWGYALGSYLKKMEFTPVVRRLTRLFTILLLVLILSTSIWTTFQIYQDIEIYQNYASIWDARDLYIQSQRLEGVERVLMPAINNPAGVNEPSTDEGFSVNQNMKRYYGVVVVVDPCMNFLFKDGQYVITEICE